MNTTEPGTAPLLCTIYRSNRERELYIFVDRKEGMARVPEELLTRLGTTTEVMTIKLTPERKLARVKAADVIAAITACGYFLQLPPDFQPSRFTLGE